MAAGRTATGVTVTAGGEAASDHMLHASDVPAQPPFVGAWQSEEVVGLDEFLEHALGVGYLKRAIAMRASQQQRLRLSPGEGGDGASAGVIELSISDMRGVAEHRLHPDGEIYLTKGYMRLPIEQRARWAVDGSLMVEERYNQHLGGAEHGRKCHRSSCPLFHSRRSLDAASGRMTVEVERLALDGQTYRMTTYYKRLQA